MDAPGEVETAAGVALRAPRPGELTFLLHRHMQVMAPAYGWDHRYEAHLTQIVADFLSRHDPQRERFWVAERDGRVLGCVGLTRQAERTGRLRLLFVEPEARGLGLGRRLIAHCLGFARTAGYAEVVLWTVDVLTAARRLYAEAGFQLTGSQPSELAEGMADETWRLAL